MQIDLEKKYSELKCFFEPEGVAVIGASRRTEKLGYQVLKNLIDGGSFTLPHLKGFSGKIFPVNPKADEILGLRCYHSVKDIPERVDLAIICIPAKLVPQAVKDCAEKGVKGINIISAGFAEAGEEGKRLQDEFLKIAKEAGIRIVGPNCLGTLYTPTHLNASFGGFLPLPGEVAFISQSGALMDSVIDWAVKEGYGFSAMISYGNKSDLDAPDFIAWAAKDPYTRAITLYIEGFNDGRYFLEVARRVSSIKPIIAFKAGKTSAGTKAVGSHTGSLAGSYQVYKGAFRQSGVIMADTLTQMFDLAKALAHQPPPEGNRVAIVTNGGGNGVMCADFCEELGIQLPSPPSELIEKLDRTGKMHPAWSRSNPLDIIGDAGPERYEVALEAVMSCDVYDGVIVIQTLQTPTRPMEDAKIVVEMHRKYKKPVIAAFVGGKITEPSVKYLEEHGIPNYNDMDRAAKAMWALMEYGKYLKRRGLHEKGTNLN
ncbi:CoA-binding protein [Candidatus Aerophobetes bacterium]|uniref:CoA-binding protein n=1 Tax=Aerophobetes bacterium TaxID=2030807 RepID=A0A497E575_UNCAE|nr:CoA-binding protein [Candidatus Aerophobetes bacterium]RLE09662.1 MAG: CoA-binding protein [Candidatus Aerophobetes bacterium]